jgi:cold shock CspA family protein
MWQCRLAQTGCNAGGGEDLFVHISLMVTIGF